MPLPIICVLTPRAGHWNHRFLVPTGSACSQRQLTDFVKRIKSETPPGEEDLRFARREVQQSHSGRRGPETVFVVDQRLVGIGRQGEDRIRTFLSEILDEVDVLITEKIDWDRVGEPSLVELPDLDRWRSECSELLDKFRQPAESKFPRRRETPTGKRSYKRGIVGAVLVLVLLGYLALQQLSHTNDIGHTNGEPPIGRGDGETPNGGKVEPLDLEELTPRLEALAEVLFARKIVNQRPEDLLNRLGKRLSKDLFEPRKSSRNPRQPSLSLDQSARRLERVLQDFFRVIHPDRNEFPQLLELLEDGGIQKRLGHLYPNGTFDSIGILEQTDLRNSKDKELAVRSLKALDSVTFHRLIRRLHQLVTSVNKLYATKEPSLEQSKYHPFFQVLTNEQYLPAKPLARLADPIPRERRFYLDDDATVAVHLSRVLSHKTTTSLYDGKDTDFGTTLDQQLVHLAKQYSLENSLLSETYLKVQKNVYTSLTREVFTHLDEFVKTCQSVSLATKQPAKRNR